MFSQHIYFQLVTLMLQLLIESGIHMQRFHNILTIWGGRGGSIWTKLMFLITCSMSLKT
jgi:hypothetical protein